MPIFKNKSLQYKRMTIEIKSYDPSKPLRVAGWANFAEVDRGNEIMPKECWDLKNYGDNPIMLFNHDQSRPVGRLDVFEPKDEGLWIEGEIGNPEAGHPLTEDQEMVRSLVAQKILNSMSVGYIPHEYKIDEKTGVLTHIRAELMEVSIVSVPMQQSSQFQSVKGVKKMDEQLQAALQAMNDKLDKVIAAIEALVNKSEDNENAEQEENEKKLNSLNDQIAALNAEKAELEKALEKVLDSQEA